MEPTTNFTYRNTVPTPTGPIRFLVTTEFESTRVGTVLHRRFAAPKTAKERAVLAQMRALDKLTEQLNATTSQ